MSAPPPYSQLPQAPIVEGQYQAAPIQNPNGTDRVNVVTVTGAGGVVPGQPLLAAGGLGVPLGEAGHVEPATVSTGVKVAIAISWLCLIVIVLGYIFAAQASDDDGTMMWFPIYMAFVLAISVVAVMVKFPKSITLSPTCIILQTRCTSISVAYERISRIEILPSICCWTGAACDFPRGGFTSYSNGIYFRSADCGQSIAFSPEDLNRLVAHLQRSPLANRIVQGN